MSLRPAGSSPPACSTRSTTSTACCSSIISPSSSATACSRNSPRRRSARRRRPDRNSSTLFRQELLGIGPRHLRLGGQQLEVDVGLRQRIERSLLEAAAARDERQ